MGRDAGHAGAVISAGGRRLLSADVVWTTMLSIISLAAAAVLLLGSEANEGAWCIRLLLSSSRRHATADVLPRLGIIGTYYYHCCLDSQCHNR